MFGPKRLDVSLKRWGVSFDASSCRKMYEVPLEDVWSCRDKAYQLPSEARWCRRCRQNLLDHTLLYVVNLLLVGPVYEM